MKNFDYLKQYDCLKSLHEMCDDAETFQKSKPRYSANSARTALEWVMRAIYQIEKLGDTTDMDLFQMIDNYAFKEYLNDSEAMKRLHYIRKVGNKGSHMGESVSQRESFFALLNLYEVVGGMLKRFHIITELAPFNKDLIPDGEITIAPKESYHSAPINMPSAEPSIEPMRIHKPSAADISEAETRKLFIDQMLEEAGWEVMEKDGAIEAGKACIEVEVEGMPNNHGVGYADYVLFGLDGKPLAVVEAKRASKDPAIGRQQAELYAQCLEKKYGVLPVVYYSNGYSTFVIDQLGYPPRELYSFHSLDDLTYMHQKRGRNGITDMNGRKEIAGRDYQLTAVKAVCEHFNKKKRRALLVMATGTGKTRTAISLVDVMMRNNWAKRVLFLADRTSLVTQAHRAFEQQLPNETKETLNDNRKPELNKRLTFSTYQTMINFIDKEEKALSVGHFDLIIIDEAHRSIFGKYKSILDYFDALVVGMTATPRDEVDRSTYELMELNDEPNFSYELQEAVNDGYLVNFTPKERESEILNEGIKYNELSKKERDELEGVWEYEKALRCVEPHEEYHRDIKKSEIDSYIYNIDTIDNVLRDLMEHGLKISGGDVIGKSIIFASNHKHAVLITERFGKLYPHLGPDYCRLIDNTVNYAQSLIDDFSDPAKLPQIAVSVDMMDTGIDVPSVLNLVFFKVVKSKIKFMQMVGRGTRLCSNVFGVGEDKKTFYIFDWCGNLRYFSIDSQPEPESRSKSLSEKLFNLRLDIAVALQNSYYQEDEYNKELHDSLKKILHKELNKLSNASIAVRKNLEIVEEFRNEKRWDSVSQLDAKRLKDNVSPLLIGEKDDEFAKRFDVLVLNCQLLQVNEMECGSYQQKVMQLASMLEEKSTIKQIHDKLEIIREVQKSDFWKKESLTLKRLERVRTEIRELIHFLAGQNNKTFNINIQDNVSELDSADITLPTNMTYKQKVLDYLDEHSDSECVRKIMNLEKLTAEDLRELEKAFWEELGDKKDYDRMTIGKPYTAGNVAAFVRTVTGIDRDKAMQIYRSFISGGELSSMQETCLKEIVDFVCVNGDIMKENIRDNAPFKNINWQRVFGNNMANIVKFVNEMHNVITA